MQGRAGSGCHAHRVTVAGSRSPGRAVCSPSRRVTTAPASDLRVVTDSIRECPCRARPEIGRIRSNSRSGHARVSPRRVGRDSGKGPGRVADTGSRHGPRHGFQARNPGTDPDEMQPGESSPTRFANIRAGLGPKSVGSGRIRDPATLRCRAVESAATQGRDRQDGPKPTAGCPGGHVHGRFAAQCRGREPSASCTAVPCGRASGRTSCAPSSAGRG